MGGESLTEAIWKTIANRIVEKNEGSNKKTEEITVEEKNKAKAVKKEAEDKAVAEAKAAADAKAAAEAREVAEKQTEKEEI